MPTGKLKALNVARAKKPGMYGDGGGLYLQVTGAGAKSWVYRYWVPERDPATGELVRDPATKKGRGTSREMGLGSFTVVTLDEAREAAAEVRRLRHQSIDPIEARREAKQTKAIEKAKALKFRDAAATYIAAHRAGWRNEKHGAQWTATLETYAYPVIGDLSVQAIDTGLVLKVLEPIWTEKPETAGRVRGRIEAVLDWAKVRGYRVGENPARWKGHLALQLPARAKVRKVRHHPALPYDQIGAFMTALRERDSISARALEFTILTAVRTGDITGDQANEKPGARWDQVDFRGRVWTIPSTKSDRELRVPLSDAALAVLTGRQANAEGDYIFPGGRKHKPLSNAAMAELLKGMGDWHDRRGDQATVHGFRSSFRDWAAERTNFPSEVVEMALAHTIGDKVEAAYRRGDLFDKRTRLMAEWGRFCGKPTATGAVVPLRAKT